MADEDFSTIPMPLLPPTSLEARLRHFDDPVFNVGPETHLYRLMDALCGDAGAGDLKKNLLIDRLNKQLPSMHFWDLDRLFGGTIGLVRLKSESYPWDPETDMLNSDQWDEIRVKDAWFRARALDFWKACQAGGTPEGFRRMVMSALGVTCDIFESWQFIDNYGIKETIGRTGKNLRNEVFVKPHKETLTPKDKQLALHAIDRIRPVDSIVTIDLEGVPLHKPISFRTISTDSSYFEIRKEVTGTPDLAKIPPPEVLEEDIRASEAWLQARTAVAAPNTAFNNSMETSIYYVYDPAGRSPVDSVSYFSEDQTGVRKRSVNYQEVTELNDAWTPFKPYDLADSPDNFPGGKYGQHPATAPALNRDGTPYSFSWASQADYVRHMKQSVVSSGGEANDTVYRLPLKQQSTSTKTYTPDMALPLVAPGTESTVTSPWISPRPGDQWSSSKYVGIVPWLDLYAYTRGY